MTDWIIAFDRFEPDSERQREALFTLANGYLGTRNAATWATADSTHYPGTYVAGVYNRLTSEIEGETVEIESIVNVPNWLPLTWRVGDGDWFDLREATIHDYRHELDMRRGVVTRTLTVEDADRRRSTLTERRITHMRHPHLAALETTIRAENWSGSVQVRSGIDGAVVNGLVASDADLNNDHLDTAATGAEDEIAWLRARTARSRVEIAVATRTRLRIGETPVVADARAIEAGHRIEQITTVALAEGDTLAIEKVAAIFTSRDPAISESVLAARDAARVATGFEKLLASHVETWEWLWGRSDIALKDGDDDTQRTVRLHLFHLLQTASVHTRHVDTGLLARGLSGEAYHGHVFWDELFILPWLDFHFPSVSRTLLGYRYRQLDAARARARDAGLKGAMYPWQSGSDGTEATPPFYPNPRNDRWIRDHTPIQRHIGAAVAWNVWHHVEVTGDLEYLADEGAEMLVEIARFWSSIARFSEEHGRYEIHGVMGPDEFHNGYPWSAQPGLSNNTHTNVMAVWTLRTARYALGQLPAWRRDELRALLHLTDDELAHWDDVSRRMRIAFLPGGELAQFEHWDRLEELDWDAYEERYGDLQRLDFILDEEGDTPNRYRVSKQPDVLMLFYLFSDEEVSDLLASLGYDFDDDARKRTVDHYLERSTRGSTLSRVVDAEIFAGVDPSRSWECLQIALQSDIGDLQGGSTAEGLHLGAMGGTIAIIERRYTGIEPRGDVLHVAPSLPKELKRLDLSLLYRGHRLDVSVTHDRLRVSAGPGGPQPVTIALGDRTQEITPDEPIDWEW